MAHFSGVSVSAVSVSGKVVTETNNGINTITITAIGGSSPTDITGTSGNYSLTFTPGENTTITPSKNNDVSTNNGITTLDTC